MNFFYNNIKIIFVGKFVRTLANNIFLIIKVINFNCYIK